MFKKVAKKAFSRLGLSVSRLPQQIAPSPLNNGLVSGVTADMEEEFVQLLTKCRPFTMTSALKLYSLYCAVNHVSQSKVSGAFVECGVWKGGSSMMAAFTFTLRGDTQREFFLYDTFKGMSAPSEKDRKITEGGMSADAVKDKWLKSQIEGVNQWSYSPHEEVSTNMNSTGYPDSQIHLVKGKVEDTIPRVLPQQIAILRLDTDWFESTWHEMTYLFPLISPGGVLIIDDYGSWEGSREAVDRYFKENNISMLLHKAHTSRVGIKI